SCSSLWNRTSPTARMTRHNIKMEVTPMSKAVVFFAEGTEECEALLVVDLLRRGKIEVVVASASGSLTVTGSHKVTITADALAEDIDYAGVDLVVLPGGIPGTPNLA